MLCLNKETFSGKGPRHTTLEGSMGVLWKEAWGRGKETLLSLFCRRPSELEEELELDRLALSNSLAVPFIVLEPPRRRPVEPDCDEAELGCSDAVMGEGRSFVFQSVRGETGEGRVPGRELVPRPSWDLTGDTL